MCRRYRRRSSTMVGCSRPLPLGLPGVYCDDVEFDVDASKPSLNKGASGKRRGNPGLVDLIELRNVTEIAQIDRDLRDIGKAEIGRGQDHLEIVERAINLVGEGAGNRRVGDRIQRSLPRNKNQLSHAQGLRERTSTP